MYLPRGVNGSPLALDFACTSGLRADSMFQSIQDPTSVLSAYTLFKQQYRPNRDDEPTEAQCTRQGFGFVPMVIEAHSGGWCKEARQVLDAIAKHTAAAWNLPHEEASLKIAQRLSMTLQRENARAILKRLGDPSPEPTAVQDGHTATPVIDLWQ